MPNLLEKFNDLLCDEEDVRTYTPQENATQQSVSNAQAAVTEHPYDISKRLELAAVNEALGHPDLAAGDAYKTLLLIDEARDEEGEFHDQVMAANSWADSEEALQSSSKRA